MNRIPFACFILFFCIIGTLPSQFVKRKPSSLNDQLAFLRKVITCQEMVNGFLSATSPKLWDRAWLNTFANQPRFLVQEGDVSPFAQGDLVLVNNSLPKNKTVYFSVDSQTKKTVEEWRHSALIKVPSHEEGIAGFENIHAGIVHPGRSFHYYNKRIDMGVSSSGDHFYQLAFKNPEGNFPEYRQKLIFADILSTTNLSEPGMRTSLSLDINGKEQFSIFRLGELEQFEQLPAGLEGIKDAYWNFFHDVYADRFSLSPKFLDLLVQASEEIKDRTVTLVSFEKAWKTLFQESEVEIAANNEKGIKGAFSYVISRNPEELLPFEKTAELVAKEKSSGMETRAWEKIGYKRDPQKTYAEFTRLAVNKEEFKTTTPDVIQLLAASAKGSNVDVVVAYVDPIHKRMFSKFGFEVRAEHVDEFGEKFYVVDASPDTVLKHVMEFYHPSEVPNEQLPEVMRFIEGFRPVR